MSALSNLQIPDLTVTIGDITCCNRNNCCIKGAVTVGGDHMLKEDAPEVKSDVTVVSPVDKKLRSIKGDIKAIEAVRRQFSKIAVTVAKHDRSGKAELKPVVKPRDQAKIPKEKNRETVEAYHSYCVREYKSREIAAVVTTFAGANLIKLHKHGDPLLGSDTEAVKIATTKLSPIIEDIKLVIIGINAAAMVDIREQRKKNAARISGFSEASSDKKTAKLKKRGASSSITVVKSAKDKKEVKRARLSDEDKIGALFLDAVLRVQQLSTARGLSKQVLNIKSIREIHTVFQKMDEQETVEDAVGDDQLGRNRVLEIIQFAQVVHKIAVDIIPKREEALPSKQLCDILTHIQGLKDNELKMLLPVQAVAIDVTDSTETTSSF